MVVGSDKTSQPSAVVTSPRVMVVVMVTPAAIILPRANLAQSWKGWEISHESQRQI